MGRPPKLTSAQRAEALERKENGEPHSAIARSFNVSHMTIQRLRRQAQDELGDRFDIRAFHGQVLDSGALPLSVLEDKIDRWIAQVRTAPPAHGRRGARIRG